MSNPLLSSGALRPEVLVTTSQIYLGQEYTWTGLDGSDIPYYNIEGGSGPTVGSISYGANIDGWTVYDLDGDAINDATAPGGSFPSQATGWTNGPVTAGTGSGLVSFNGSNGMAGDVVLYAGGSATGSIWIDYEPTDLVSTGVVFETGTGLGTAVRRSISIQQVASVLACSVFESTPLANTKTVTLDGSRVLLNFQWNTDEVVPANQTSLVVNNSATGVTSPVSTDVNGNDIGDGIPSVGCRDAGGTPSMGWTGYLRGIYPYGVTQDNDFRTGFTNYWLSRLQ